MKIKNIWNHHLGIQKIKVWFRSCSFSFRGDFQLKYHGKWRVHRPMPPPQGNNALVRAYSLCKALFLGCFTWHWGVPNAILMKIFSIIHHFRANPPPPRLNCDSKAKTTVTMTIPRSRGTAEQKRREGNGDDKDFTETPGICTAASCELSFQHTTKTTSSNEKRDPLVFFFAALKVTKGTQIQPGLMWGFFFVNGCKHWEPGFQRMSVKVFFFTAIKTLPLPWILGTWRAV